MDVEIEIAASVTDPKSFYVFFTSGVKSSMFADKKCGEVYMFAERYWRTHGSMSDTPTFEMICEKFDWYEQLIEGVSGGAAPSFLVEKLKSRYVKRSAESVLRKGIPLLDDDPLSASRMMSSALASVTQMTSARGDTVEYGVDLEYQELMDREADSVGNVPYPVALLNDRTGGMRDGELTVFAAKASGGKTWFACATALGAVKAGVDTYFATLEMPVQQMLQRIELLDCGTVSPLLWSRGARTSQDRAKMKETRLRIASYPGRLVVDQPPAGERSINSLVARCKAHGCKFMVIDQLQFVTKPSGYEKGYQALEQVMYDMKTAISAPSDGVKLPILLMHQFNREGVKAQGKDGLIGNMSNLAGSSVIEQVADTIWGLGPSIDGTSSRRTLAVLKGRRFPEFGFQMVWDTDDRARIEVDTDYEGRPIELEKW